MLKRIIMSAIIGTSALSMATANAETQSSTLTDSIDLSPTLNHSSHLYIGGQLGYANTHMANKLIDPNAKNPFEAATLSNDDLAGRIYVGYQFNPYLAVELGYLQLANTNKKGIDQGIAAEKKLDQHAVDVLAKASMPIANNLSVYGKLGMAYLTTNIRETFNYSTPDHDNVPVTINLNNQFGISKHIWAPEAAIGINYNITPNISVDTSWTHIQPLGNKKPGNIDFVALGLGYQFG